MVKKSRFLRIWNKRVFGNIFDKTLEAEEEVRQAELCLEDGDTEETRTQWAQATATLNECLATEEIFWR